MEGLIISLLWLLAGIMMVMMLVQGFQRKVDLLSIRNIYLAGFIVYQVASPITALEAGGTLAGFRIIDPIKSAKWFVMYSYVFAAIYLLSYHRIRLVHKLASKIRVRHGGSNDGILTGLAIALIVGAFAAQMISRTVLPLRAVSVNVSVALAAASCALAGWVWGKRRLNPAVLSMCALVIGMSH
jgi:hypothetical protein